MQDARKVMAERHREFIEYLLSLGLSPYRISMTMNRNHQYVHQALEKTWAPTDATIDAYVEKLFLNREWLRTGKGKMVTNNTALKAFAASVAHKKRAPRNSQ